MIAILSASTQYITTNVTSSSNPTAASVSMAFVGPYSDQQSAAAATVTSSTTYYAGSWVGQAANSTTQWTAQVLVGPNGGVVTLTSGTYVMFVKIFSTPETPIVRSGYVEVA